MGNSHCCNDSIDSQELNDLTGGRKNGRPYSQRNFNIKGEISLPVKFEEYEATEQYIPKRDRVVIRSHKIFDNQGRFSTPYRKIIEQVVMNEIERVDGKRIVVDESDTKVYQIDELDKSKFTKHFKNEMMSSSSKNLLEVKNKYGSDAFLNAETGNVYYKKKFVKTGMPNQLRKYEEDKEQLEKYGNIDLTNKKDSFVDSPSKSADKRRKLYNRGYDVDQEGENGEEESAFRPSSTFARQAYLIKKHLNSSDEIDYEEIVEPHQTYIKDRNTQTPIRQVVDEGVQHEPNALYSGDLASKLGNQRLKSREERSLEADEDAEHPPFSSIKKDKTDSESIFSRFENTPIRDADLDRIFEMVRTDERLQQKIMNDPYLRERFIEKAQGMRHSGSDQTLPYTVYSSKHGDRRTQANTYLYHTPRRSDDIEGDGSRKSPRFTQFTRSDYINEEGKIYDEAVMTRARDKRSQFVKADSSIQENPAAYISRENRPKHSHDENFSFLEEKKHKAKGDRLTQKQISPNYHRSAKTYDIDENENDLFGEGEENIERKFLEDENIANVPSMVEKQKAGSRSKSNRRVVVARFGHKTSHDSDSHQPESSINKYMKYSDPYSNMDRNKHSNSQNLIYYDESNIHPGYDEESHPSSKNIDEMKIKKTTMYDIERDMKTMTDKRIRARDEADVGAINTPKQHKHSMYVTQLVKNVELETPEHSDGERDEDRDTPEQRLDFEETKLSHLKSTKDKLSAHKKPLKSRTAGKAIQSQGSSSSGQGIDKKKGGKAEKFKDSKQSSGKSSSGNDSSGKGSNKGFVQQYQSLSTKKAKISQKNSNASSKKGNETERLNLTGIESAKHSKLSDYKSTPGSKIREALQKKSEDSQSKSYKDQDLEENRKIGADKNFSQRSTKPLKNTRKAEGGKPKGYKVKKEGSKFDESIKKQSSFSAQNQSESFRSSLRLPGQINDQRQRYKSKGHKSIDFNKRLADSKRSFNPKRLFTADLRDEKSSEERHKQQEVQDQSSEEGIIPDEPDVSAIGSGDRIPPSAHRTEHDYDYIKEASATRRRPDSQLGSVAGSTLLKDQKEERKYIESRRKTAKPSYSSNRSISYLEKARIKNKRMLRSPKNMYNRYKDVKNKIRSNSRHERDNDNLRNTLHTDIGVRESGAANLYFSTLERDDGSHHSSLKDRNYKLPIQSKFGLSSEEDEEYLAKYERMGAQHRQIDISKENSSHPGQSSHDIQTQNQYYDINNRYRRFTSFQQDPRHDSNATEEQKLQSLSIRDRPYNQPDSTEVQDDERRLKNEGDIDDQVLGEEQSSHNKDIDPSHMQFNQTQNLSNVLRDVSEYGPDVDLRDASLGEGGHRGSLPSQDEPKHEESKSFQPISSKYHRASAFSSEEDTIKPANYGEVEPSQLADSRVAKLDAATSGGYSSVLYHQRSIKQSDERTPADQHVKGGDLVQRQESTHEQYVTGLHPPASPSKRPPISIVHMADDDLEELDEEDKEEHNIEHPEQVYVKGMNKQHMDEYRSSKKLIPHYQEIHLDKDFSPHAHREDIDPRDYNEDDFDEGFGHIDGDQHFNQGDDDNEYHQTSTLKHGHMYTESDEDNKGNLSDDQNARAIKDLTKLSGIAKHKQTNQESSTHFEHSAKRSLPHEQPHEGEIDDERASCIAPQSFQKIETDDDNEEYPVQTKTGARLAEEIKQNDGQPLINRKGSSDKIKMNRKTSQTQRYGAKDNTQEDANQHERIDDYNTSIQSIQHRDNERKSIRDSHFKGIEDQEEEKFDASNANQQNSKYDSIHRKEIGDKDQTEIKGELQDQKKRYSIDAHGNIHYQDEHDSDNLKNNDTVEQNESSNQKGYHDSKINEESMATEKLHHEYSQKQNLARGKAEDVGLVRRQWQGASTDNSKRNDEQNEKEEDKQQESVMTPKKGHISEENKSKAESGTSRASPAFSSQDKLSQTTESKHKHRLDKLKQQLESNQEEMTRKYSPSRSSKIGQASNSSRNVKKKESSSKDTIQSQKERLEKKIKEIDAKLATGNQQFASEAQGVEERKHSDLHSQVNAASHDQIEHSDENVNVRTSHKKPADGNKPGIHSDKFKQTYDDFEESNRMDLTPCDNLQSLPDDEESPLYASKKGKKYDPSYYQVPQDSKGRSKLSTEEQKLAQKPDEESVHMQTSIRRKDGDEHHDQKQHILQDSDEYQRIRNDDEKQNEYDPQDEEVKRIEDKYRRADDPRDEGKPSEYKGPLSRYLDKDMERYSGIHGKKPKGSPTKAKYTHGVPPEEQYISPNKDKRVSGTGQESFSSLKHRYGLKDKHASALKKESDHPKYPLDEELERKSQRDPSQNNEDYGIHEEEKNADSMLNKHDKDKSNSQHKHKHKKGHDEDDDPRFYSFSEQTDEANPPHYEERHGGRNDQLVEGEDYDEDSYQMVRRKQKIAQTEGDHKSFGLSFGKKKASHPRKDKSGNDSQQRDGEHIRVEQAHQIAVGSEEDEELHPYDYSIQPQEIDDATTGKFGGASNYQLFSEGVHKDKSGSYSKIKNERMKAHEEATKKKFKKYLSKQEKLKRYNDELRGKKTTPKSKKHKFGSGKKGKEEAKRRPKGLRKNTAANLLDAREGRIQSQEQVLEGDGYSINPIGGEPSSFVGYDPNRHDSSSFHELHKIVDKIPANSGKDIGRPFGESKFSFEYDNEHQTPSHTKGKRSEHIRDEYQRIHQNMIERLSGSKTGEKNKKAKKEQQEKLIRSDIKNRSMLNQMYDESMHHNRTDFDEGSSVMELDYTLLDPDEPIIVDNGIMKFHPGFSINYVSRWIQVTKTVIRFYKNYYHSVCSFRRPLAAIPIKYILDVKKCRIKPKKSNAAKILQKGGKNAYDLNQFEIVLKEDYEAIYNLNKRKKELEDLRYELDLIQRLDFQNKLTQKYKQYRQRCRRERRANSTSINNSVQSHSRGRGGFRDFVEFEQEEIKKLSRSHPRLDAYSVIVDNDSCKTTMKLNNSHTHLRPEDAASRMHESSVISRGRQKQMEASGDRSVISIDEQYVHSSCSKSRSKSKRNKGTLFTARPSKRCKTPFDATQIVDGHLMPLRINKRDRSGKSAFRPKTKSKKKAKCEWSKRETDWFKFERRFILSTKTKKERKLWMSVIKDLINN